MLKMLGWLLAAFLLYYYLFPALLKTFNFILPLVLPFILGLLLAALLEPLIVLAIKKLKLSRGISVLATMVIVFGGTITGLGWMIARAIMELFKLSQAFPGYAREIVVGLEYLFSQARILYFALELPMDWQNALLERLEAVSAALIGSLSMSLGALTAVPNGILILFFAIISCYFFSKDKDRISQTMYQLLPGPAASFLHNMGNQTGNAVLGYLRAQLILMLITMGQTLIALYLLKVDYALLITVVIGFLDLLPVLGPGFVLVPWIVVAFFLGQTKLAFALLVLYGIISIVRQLVQPKVVGDSIGIHPLETLISLYIGLKVLGVLGLILGPILLVVGKGCWRYFQESKVGH
ncbi:MAG: sporulation integral membrane protein YtvI [Clostridia bacterium]|nr:sporulation integral membrane protein YtvI [Clostridia bacterium]